MTVPQRLTFYGSAGIINVFLFKLANGMHLGVDRLMGKNVNRAKAQAKGKRT